MAVFIESKITVSGCESQLSTEESLNQGRKDRCQLNK
jgi:hypothetical protein